MNVDKDGIWKDAVEQYLPLLLKRMMPELYEDLDKELRDTIQVSLSEEHNSAKFVDTLVQVPLKSGKINGSYFISKFRVRGRRYFVQNDFILLPYFRSL